MDVFILPWLSSCEYFTIVLLQFDFLAMECSVLIICSSYISRMYTYMYSAQVFEKFTVPTGSDA